MSLGPAKGKDFASSFGPYMVTPDELEDAWERSEMFELKDRATVLVAEWKSAELARNDDFEERRDQIVQRLTVQRLRDAAADWFDPDKIRARSEFELSR